MWREFEIAGDVRRDQLERDTTLAWQVVKFYCQSKSKGLPSLSSVLPKKNDERVNWRPSLEQQRANLEAISRQYRIPLKVVPAA